jgi:serine/threonine protein phosphatase PrpC
MQATSLEDEPHTTDSDKGHTFRKRRLSLTLAKPREEEDDDDDKNTDDSPRPAQRRRSSVASTASGSSVPPSKPKAIKRHLSVTLHSTELLGGPQPPPSPAVTNTLYQIQTAAAPSPPQLSFNFPAALPRHWSQQQKQRRLNPRWKKRHHPTEASQLPFSKDIVGTYSCHGVEPIYNYDEEEDEEEEEVTPVATTTRALSDSTASLTDEQVPPAPTKPTMVAKINQDRGGIAYPYGNCPRTALFAVYDGHGQGGELVSQYALHEVQRRLERHPTFGTNLEKAFRDTFTTVDESLRNEPMIEPFYAGTTACVALLQHNELTMANAGDSRTVMARSCQGAARWEALELTQDQNPDLPEEQARIISQGGFVSAPPAPGLSARVWLDAGLTQIGLAMARSIGDHAVATVGVIADPVVSRHTITAEDDFMILASDGVWEFLSSQQAVAIVGEHLERGATKACQALIEAAASRWHDEEGEYRDDITAIVVRLPGLWEASGEPPATS